MTRTLVRLGVALVLLGSMAACGDTSAPVVPTSAGPATTATAPTASADEPTGSGSEAPLDEPVDLVVMAASGGAGVAERYGPLLAEALGREVRYHDKIGAHPAEVLSGVESGADVVAGAEVILMYFPPIDYEPPEFLV